jgi:hypothetical protein
MEFKTTMSIEDAIEFVGEQKWNEDSLKRGGFNTPEEATIHLALSNYNYRVSKYKNDVLYTLNDLKKILIETQDIFENLDIRFNSIEDYVYSDNGNIKFNAWSQRYVYVKGCYDGGEWVVAIERNPTNNLNSPIGGG